MRLFSYLFGQISGAGPAHRRASRPRLEVLEDRCVPSVLPVNKAINDVNKPGTLRYAVAHAGDGDVIRFSPALHGAPIVLTQGELLLNHNVTIESQKDGPEMIDGNHLSRVFEVASGTSVTLSGVLITGGNGLADNPDGDASQDVLGGGILVDAGASLTVSDSTLSGNSAEAGGGAIFNRGTATVTGCTLSHNSAGFGGGLYNSDGGTATVTDSTVSGNSAEVAGGGLYNYYGGTLSVTGCTLSGNSAFSPTQGEFLVSYGGGIASDGTLTVKCTTVSGNTTDAWGAGIYTDGTATVSDSVIRGNSGPPGFAAVAYGAGIFNLGTLTVNACDLAQQLQFLRGRRDLQRERADHQGQRIVRELRPVRRRHLRLPCDDGRGLPAVRQHRHLRRSHLRQ